MSYVFLEWHFYKPTVYKGKFTCSNSNLRWTFCSMLMSCVVLLTSWLWVSDAVTFRQRYLNLYPDLEPSDPSLYMTSLDISSLVECGMGLFKYHATDTAALATTSRGLDGLECSVLNMTGPSSWLPSTHSTWLLTILSGNCTQSNWLLRSLSVIALTATGFLDQCQIILLSATGF